MKTITIDKNIDYLAEAAECYKKARCAVALTGAGISVNSGIADFRSPGGVWTKFSPDEYATLTLFKRNPEKAWELYRELGRGIVGKTPNRAHKVLAELEKQNSLRGLITQNVDNLHQAAGSKKVLEIHGDHQHLQCLQCGDLIPATEEHYNMDGVPECPLCNYPYKPNVVLFGEGVRHLETIENLIMQCDLLLVIGTSAKVHPAATLPEMVKQNGGLIYEFNMEPALGQSSHTAQAVITDYFFKGDLSTTIPAFAQAIKEK